MRSPKTMEGGYINEAREDADLMDKNGQGGQLKTKNGQKYIINDQPEGIYVRKSLVVLLGILGVMGLIVIGVLCYLAFGQPASCLMENGANEDSINTAEMFSGIVADDPTILDFKTKEIELYEGWNPLLYKLLLEPNFESATTNGTVWINIVRDPTVKGIQPIVLDIKNITIYDVKVLNLSLNSTMTSIHHYGDKKESYIINLKGATSDNSDNITYQVQINFVSSITDILQGFYRSSYADETGKKKWVASTQFSPIEARRAFPCFDRPDKKAEFLVSIIRSHDKPTTLSNMPKAFEQIARPGYVMEDFEKTPKMSPYLLAFIVSDLQRSQITASTSNSLPPINIYTRPQMTDMTQFAYDEFVKLLPFYENYLDTKYELPKLDIVAIPEFGFSAMENWGLITFRESALIAPSDNNYKSSAFQIFKVAGNIAHELAHQWFGNLVTMKWWNELWLKEAFCEYLAIHSLNEIHPEWHINDFKKVEALQTAFAADSNELSRAIVSEITIYGDIYRLFDGLSYDKSAAIFRMIQSFLGEVAFKEALQNVLKRFAYSNFDAKDFFDILTEVGHKYGTLPQGLTVNEIMTPWFNQPGYPILTAKRNGTSISIIQQRFTLPKVNRNDTSKWYIPVSFETSQSKSTIHWFSNKTNSLEIENALVAKEWFYLNVDRLGYYRVNYDYESWILLAKNFRSLPAVTRAQLLDDSLTLARAEEVGYDIPMFLLTKLAGLEDEAIAWISIQTQIQYIITMLNRDPAYEYFKAFMHFIVKKEYDRLKFNELPEEDNLQLIYRTNILDIACQVGYDRCTNAAQQKFRDWMRDKNNNPISPNLKKIVYATAIREGTHEEWNFLYSRYLATDDASEKDLILNALGQTSYPWLLNKYLNMTLSTDSQIRKQDGSAAFKAIASNNIGYEIAFDFLMSNLEKIVKYYGDGFNTLEKMILSLTSYLNKEYQREQMYRLAKKADSLGMKNIIKSIKLALDKVNNNIEWRTRSYQKLYDTLKGIITDLHINM